MATKKEKTNDTKKEVKKPAQKKILLIEDDRFIARAYTNGIEQKDFIIEHAVDGESALAWLRSNKADLILLDIVMPKMNGFQILEIIKEDKKLKAIPVVILSNLGQDLDIEKGKNLGAIDHLVKVDLSIAELSEKVAGYLH